MQQNDTDHFYIEIGGGGNHRGAIKMVKVRVGRLIDLGGKKS